MRVVDFINDQISKLKNEGYKKIEFLSASDCTLTRTGTLESIMFEGAGLDQKCSLYEFHKTPEDEQYKGIKIRMFAVAKRKRKGETLIYYVRVIEE